MDVHAPEDEQAVKVKKWIKENGISLVVGVVVGLGAVGGWKAWQEHHLTRAQQASVAYEQLLQTTGLAVDDAAVSAAIKQAELVAQEYESTPYGALAHMLSARLYVNSDKPADARKDLEWVITNGKQLELRELARLRLVRLKLDAGELDAALADLGDTAPVGFESEHAELRGDALAQQGKVEDAKAAYRQALLTAPAERSGLVEIKLDDLGVAGEQ